MFKRKLFSAFFASSYFVLILSVLSDTVSKDFFYNLAIIWGPMVFISLYTFPLVFIYGIGVSTLLEIGFNRLRFRGKRLINGILHILFGLLGSFILSPILLMVFGGTAAFFFFVVDELVKANRNIRRFLFPLSFFPLMIVLVSYIFYFPYMKLEDAKYTAAEAILFATSGKSKVTLFPSDVNEVVETDIDGYKITRSTGAEKVGDGEFKVTLSEKWEKDGVKGESHAIYRVEKHYGATSLMGAGGYGDKIPYNQ